MTDSQQQIVQNTIDFVKEKFLEEWTGHDRWHIERVYKTASAIAQQETWADLFVVQLGALLHDIADYKFHDGDESVGPRKTQEWLESQNVNADDIVKVVDIVANVSFKGWFAEDKPKSLELKIVQDADRLDGLGAIGIARAFAFGWSIKRPIYDPRVPANPDMTKEEYIYGKSHTINHFYEKLLRLKDLMNTGTAQKMAQERHQRMEQFLERFYKEREATS